MSKRKPKNVGRSIRERLMNLAKTVKKLKERKRGRVNMLLAAVFQRALAISCVGEQILRQFSAERWFVVICT